MIPDEQLMATIKEKWGEQISAATALSSLPESFLAALIANESGGNPTATRFEPAVNARLAKEHSDWTPDRIRANASSWGLTQIMGINYDGPPADLADPAVNLKEAVKLLAEFAKSYWLDLAIDFEQLFRCWNTGRPVGGTYDPNYVPNGLARMKLYV